MLQEQQIAPQAQLHPAQQYQPAVPSNPELILDALANSIAEFRYEAESGVTFEAWFTRYEDMFAKDASRLGDEAKICKKCTEDLIAFSCRVNRACIEFQFASMNEETFKCLMLVCGLKDEADIDLRTRLLARIEERNDVTLEQLSAECQRITSVKGDCAMIADMHVEL
uniref:DUF7083 domain-containing protein n=1 Tax=Anopheles arabiensis TaxID=7173 RepID=A0A182HXF7_ANOAR